MRRKPFSGRRTFCGVVLALIALACSDATGPGKEPVASVEITGMPAELFVGGTAPLASTVRDAGGNALTGRAIAWTSSDSTVAAVSAQGVVTARRVGQAVIVATSEQKSGVTTVRVAPDPVASVEITGMPAELYVGTTAALGSTVRDAKGSTLTGRAVSWTSSDSTIVAVSAEGVVTARALGQAVIVATSEQKSATATMRVAPDPVATVEITGAPSAPVLVGASVPLAAVARSAAGAVLSGRPVTWTSSDEGMATVTAQGVVQALREGEVLVTATVEGKSATAAIRATLQPPASVQITGPAAPVVTGTTAQLVAVARNAAGAVLPGRVFTWTSGDTALATVSPTGQVQTRRAGEVAITAANHGVSASFTLRIQDAVATVQIVGAPEGDVRTGAQVQLRAVARNAAGDSLGGRQVFWMSTNFDMAPVSVNGLVTTNYAGTVSIMATIEGVNAAVTLRIVDPVALVSVTPAQATLYTTQSVQLTATPRNRVDAPLADRPVTWSTSDPLAATVDSTGKVTAVGAGQVTISATAEEKTGTVTLRVHTRPTPDWSQATAWTTHQGNAAHTGYVPVTADPLVFQEQWVRSPLGSTVLNPVTEGGGRVFVSGYAYFGGQSLAAVNESTGTNAWTYAFGTIHGVHPPAYGNGRVYVTTSGHDDSYLWAFDAASGSTSFRSPYSNQWSRYFAPTVVGESVYMAGGYYGGMYAFGATEGDQRWFASTNQYDEWTPAVGGGRVYAYTGGYAPSLQVHDAATGAAVYSIADPGFSWYGWSTEISPVLGSMNNLLVTQGGRLISFDLASRTIGWQRTGSFQGNVTVGDGVLYVNNAGAVEARRESDGTRLWTWVPPSGENARETMIATRNMLFVTTGARTYGIDLAAREMTWSYDAGGHLSLTQSGLLLIAQESGALAAVTLK